MKVAIVAVVILAIAVLGIGAFVVLNKPQTTGNSSVPANSQAEDKSGQKSIAEMLALGTNLECTLSDATGTSGTVYVQNESTLRGDFVSAPGATAQNSHVILKDREIYVWTDSSTTGFKASLAETNTSFAQLKDYASGPIGDSVDVNSKVDYDCKNWAYDDSKFTLPSGVDFQDFTGLVNNIKNEAESTSPNTMTPEQKSYACQSCDSLPTEEAQTMCRESLGCN